MSSMRRTLRRAVERRNNKGILSPKEQMMNRAERRDHRRRHRESTK